MEINIGGYVIDLLTLRSSVEEIRLTFPSMMIQASVGLLCNATSSLEE
jgi:hypothetical protein